MFILHSVKEVSINDSAVFLWVCVFSTGVCVSVQVAVKRIFAALEHCWQYTRWVIPLCGSHKVLFCVITALCGLSKPPEYLSFRSLFLHRRASLFLVNHKLLEVRSRLHVGLSCSFLLEQLVCMMHCWRIPVMCPTEGGVCVHGEALH